MQRHIRSTSNQSQKNTKQQKLETTISNKILPLLFLVVLLVFLIYVQNSIWFSPEKETEKGHKKPNTNLSDWQMDFEKTLARHFMSVQWIKNLRQLESFPNSNSPEFTIRLSFPKDYPVHELIFALINISAKNQMELIESYEKISPVSFQIGFACSNGKLLKLNFREDKDLVWYSGNIAVVIDDFGYQMGESVQQFLNLPFPVTFAVIPGTQYSKQIAAKAHTSGFDVLIHLPMEALNSQVENDGYTISTKLSEQELADVVKKAVEAIPGAIGINNHMGSKATADGRTMARLMRILKNHNLIFLDSVTNRNSVAYPIAVQTGVPALKMTTYLDNPDNLKTIDKNLEEVVKNLKTNKATIVIGHDRLETAQILTREMTRWAFHGVNFVTLNELLENP